MRAVILTTAAAMAALALTGCGRPAEEAPAADAAEKAAPDKLPASESGAKPPAAIDASADPDRVPGKAVQAQTAAYTPVAISPEDQPGRARQIRCRVGDAPETACTFTPLFGDGSFQLDGVDIALRMVISDGEGHLFEVIGPERRVAIGGVYRRDPRDGACWVAAQDTAAPSPVCAR